MPEAVGRVAEQYGTTGICILLTLTVLLRVAEFLWKLREKKEVLSEKAIEDLTKAVRDNTAATRHLDQRMGLLERAAADFPKLKNDLRRSFAAIKEVAGKDWPRIRDEIMRDDFTQ